MYPAIAAAGVGAGETTVRALSIFWAAAVWTTLTACAAAVPAASDSIADAVSAAPDLADTAGEPDGTDAQTSALPQDTTADTAVSDAADVTVLTDATAADTGAAQDVDAGPPGVCFKGGPPQGDAFVADVPAPDAAPCPPPAVPPGWFADVPPATLSLTLGTGGSDGNFVPYSNGDWAPMVYGAQGGFHVWAGFKTVLPGHTEPKVTMEVQIWSESECVKVGNGLGTLVTAVQLADGSYSNVFPTSMGVADAFYLVAALSWQYCGQWVTMHVRAHLPETAVWGESQVTLRLYDTKL